MKTMPNSTQEEKYRWIKPILNGQITIKGMAKVCPFSEIAGRINRTTGTVTREVWRNTQVRRCYRAGKAQEKAAEISIDERPKEAESRLNGRPRKVLGYYTQAEKFYELITGQKIALGA